MSIQKDLSKSKLFPHLAELKLDEDVPFYAAHKKQEALQRDLAEAEARRKNDLAKAEQKKKTEAPVLKPDTTKDIAKTNTNKEKQKEAPPATPKEVATTPAPKEKPKDLSPTKTTEPQVTAKDVAVTKPEEKKKEENAVRKESAPAVKDIAVGNPALKNEPPAKPVAAVNVEKRRSETIQTVEFKSDSLLLSLYDNGEVDGDTVSVLINGEVIMPQQGLKATAIKKTIYITPALKDSFNMVLYAENLGKYPPNTGLIIVHDGDDTYQVRFSADLQKNVEVLFRRKKN